MKKMKPHQKDFAVQTLYQSPEELLEIYRSVGLSFTWKFGGYKEKKREEVDTSRFK